MSYPTLEQVDEADAVTIVGWYRFLPSPTDDKRPIMDRIVARFQALPQEERTAASKQVGWDG